MRWALMGPALLLGFACSGSVAETYGTSRRTSNVVEIDGVTRLSGPRSAPSAAKMERAESRAAPVGAAQAVALESRQSAVDAPVGPTRSVIYRGEVSLQTPEPERALGRAVEMAEKAGGYAELRDDAHVVLRVPVAAFRALYEAAADLGVVKSRSLSAQDVTERLAELGLRIEILSSSLARHEALLAKSVDTQQQLQLLRQIDRLTRELDGLRAQRERMAKLAAFSRLVVRAEGPEVELQADGSALPGFGWIDRLDPFSELSNERSRRRVELPVPDGMVELDRKRSFRAQSAEGVFVRAQRIDNDPRGSVEFWLDALTHRLGPQFGAVSRADVGGLKVVRLVQSNDASYRYLVGVIAKEDRLHIVEIYYPNAALEVRFAPVVSAALEGADT